MAKDLPASVQLLLHHVPSDAPPVLPAMSKPAPSWAFVCKALYKAVYAASYWRQRAKA